MKHPAERLPQIEVEIVENKGFQDLELLEFVSKYPHAADIMCAQSLLFKKDGVYSLPTLISKDEEQSVPEKSDQAFRARVARHTISVGFTMNLLLRFIGEKNGFSFPQYLENQATETMTLHDLKKIQEIKWRAPLGSSDKAYDAAEAHLADLLSRSGYAPEFVQLAGSIGHNGAKDFITAPSMWTIIRQCAYLSDDLLQETIIQPDILAKVHRLQTDPKYVEANDAGFPDRPGHPSFTNPDGSLRKKYDVQEDATVQMAKNVSALLGIEWQDLGKFLIQKATERKIYSALIN
jgi:hypothetical protein